MLNQKLIEAVEAANKKLQEKGIVKEVEIKLTDNNAKQLFMYYTELLAKCDSKTLRSRDRRVISDAQNALSDTFFKNS